jgi:fatty-acyl-CoA synthase
MGGSGATISFGELDERANRLARLFRGRGLERGATVAILLENNARFLEVAWAAQRSGLYYTAINTHLTAGEASYIVDDCGAGLLVSSHHLTFCWERLAAYKCPRSVDFERELPRLDTAKLYKRLLRDRYWNTPAPQASNGSSSNQG